MLFFTQLAPCLIEMEACGGAQSGDRFNISVDNPNEAEVKRLFAALSEGGSVMMPLYPTFWSPLFGMCTDKFGVNWMLSVPGPQV